MREAETRELRRALSKHAKGRGKRYDAELKDRVRAYAHRRRGEGAKYLEIGKELGLCYETVRRWCMGRGDPTSKSTSLVPVRVVDDAISAVSIVSPSGFRLEGLGAREAVLALKVLG